MEIDFSPLESSFNYILFGLIKVVGLPFAGAIILGFLLELVKVPRKIVALIASVVFLFGVYQMFMILEI